ncbi:MAG: iron-containing alcohol dehydrogenase, partial [Bacteroidota bacterium]
MTPFVFNTTPSIVFEDGAAARMGALAAKLLGPRVLLVTDAGIMKLGLADAAVDSLRDAGCTVSLFDAVEADPSRATVDLAIAAARDNEATGILGFGGGSSMDVAKLVALIAGSGEALDDAWGVGNAKGPRLPMALVPTTAGTGSEVTPVSIITVEGETKLGVVSP